MAHKKAIRVNGASESQGGMLGENNGQMRLVEAEGKSEYRMGVFCAFIPKVVEKLIWESEATEEALEVLKKRGIKPIVIPDGDRDHK